MKKPLNKLILMPQCAPFMVFHQPIHQLRLMPRAVLIHRDTAYPADVAYARQAFSHAAYRHMDILTVETWYADLPATFKRWVLREGMRVVLCRSFKEAWNSSDIRWCGEGVAA